MKTCRQFWATLGPWLPDRAGPVAPTVSGTPGHTPFSKSSSASAAVMPFISCRENNTQLERDPVPSRWDSQSLLATLSAAAMPALQKANKTELTTHTKRESKL